MTTNVFESVEAVFDSLLADRDGDFVARSISIATGVEGLSDDFSITVESPFGRVSVRSGYSETGPKPKEGTVFRQARNKRPKGMSAIPQRTFNQGIDYIKANAKNAGALGYDDEYIFSSLPDWQSWCEGISVSWRIGNGIEKNIAGLLKQRFAGRLPCRGVVSTIRKKK